MNTIEDRVRAAARAAADTVRPDSVPPLRVPAGDPAGPFRYSRPSGVTWARRLAPLAAAVAVVAVAVAAPAISRSLRPPATRAGAVSGGMVPGPPVSAYVASGRIPRYYVAITSHGNPNSSPSYAVVRATATGRTLATIVSPVAHGTIVAVTAAADDRTFVIDVQHWVNPDSGNQSIEARSFYLVRLSPAGQPGSPTRLPVSVPAGEMATGLALSPDGRQLAIAVEPDNVKSEPNLQEIRLYTLGTGAVRTWSGNGAIGSGPDDARSVSLTADGRTLAFDWIGNNADTEVVRLLDVETHGGGLLADSRVATSLNSPQQLAGLVTQPASAPSGASVRPVAGAIPTSPPRPPLPSPSAPPAAASPTAPPAAASPTAPPEAASPTAPPEAASPTAPPEAASPTAPRALPSPMPSATTEVPQMPCQGDSIITPDGSTVACGAIQAFNASMGTLSGHLVLKQDAATGFFEYSTATGEVTRTFGRWTFRKVGALSVGVLWADPSGRVLIGVIPDAGSGRVGVISGNAFTPLPVPMAAVAADSGTW